MEKQKRKKKVQSLKKNKDTPKGSDFFPSLLSDV